MGPALTRRTILGMIAGSAAAAITGVSAGTAVDRGTNLYIAQISRPWTITGTPVMISRLTAAWETAGGATVNEGPAVIQRNGKVFMTFPAATTSAVYCMGMLTASASDDLLSASSWTKNPNPVIASFVATGQYGPGHNQCTVSEDDKSDIFVYHVRSYKDISGSPLNGPNRHTRVQKIYWKADGTPDVGIPAADSLTPIRLSRYNHPDRFVQHREYRAKIEANVAPLADSQFRVVTGLTGTVSLESANFPGYFLRRKNNEVWVEKNDGTALFAGDASFTARAGLAHSAGVSYESFNLPGRYIRHYVQAVSTTTARADATFYTQRGTSAVRYPPTGSYPTVGALRTDRHCHTLAWQWPFPAPLKAVRRLCSLPRVIAGAGPLPARSCGLASHAPHRVEVRRHRGGCRPGSDSQRVRVGPDERRPHPAGT
jgi:hypothetical protein